jgi:hypothetical protein
MYSFNLFDVYSFYRIMGKRGIGMRGRRKGIGEEYNIEE